MQTKSVSALLWLALIVILLGLVVMSPSGAFALFALAAIFAAFPAALGSKRPRIFALLLLLVSLGLAANSYPAFRQEGNAYSQRAKERSAKPPVSPTTPQETNK